MTFRLLLTVFNKQPLIITITPSFVQKKIVFKKFDNSTLLKSNNVGDLFTHTKLNKSVVGKAVPCNVLFILWRIYEIAILKLFEINSTDNVAQPTIFQKYFIDDLKHMDL